jgi:hypothetical protein
MTQRGLGFKDHFAEILFQLKPCDVWFAIILYVCVSVCVSIPTTPLGILGALDDCLH